MKKSIFILILFFLTPLGISLVGCGGGSGGDGGNEKEVKGGNEFRISDLEGFWKVTWENGDSSHVQFNKAGKIIWNEGDQFESGSGSMDPDGALLMELTFFNGTIKNYSGVLNSNKNTITGSLNADDNTNNTFEAVKDPISSVLFEVRRITFNKLPDTGQSESYTNTFGEDSDYTINPPSYTKLDYAGNELPDNISYWSMVKDNVTGLIWEVKTDDGSIHDKDDRYRWQEAQYEFIESLNKRSFGGYSDWRLPTVMELSSIVDAGTDHPCINTNFFPNTLLNAYWTSTITPNWYYFGELCPWQVFTYNGDIYQHTMRSFNSSVRAVQGGRLKTDGFVDNGNGTVTDLATNLMWQQATADETTWEGAIAYCEDLKLAGLSDWRLPNRNELQSIVDYGKRNPSINTMFFPDTKASRYWSSTSSAGNSENAWLVDFNSGFVGNYVRNHPKSGIHYVRAVRSFH